MSYPFPAGAYAFFPPAADHRLGGSSSSRRRSSRSRSRSRSRDRHTSGSRGKSAQQQLDNRRTGGDSARTAQTIFVSGIHPKVDDMDLFEFFSHAGRVDDIQLIKDGRSGKSKGLAYVEMSNVEEAKKATMLHGQLVGGYPITIVMCQPTGATGGSNKPPVVSPDSLRLYVGSLHYYISEKDLEPIFEAFGELDSVEIHRDNATGQSKGFGFVQFAHRADGETAMAALDGYDIAGRAIKVGYASPTDGVGSKNPRPAGVGQPLQAGVPTSLLPQGVVLPGALAAAASSMTPAAAAAALPLPPLSASQLVPSSSLLISNMFDPATETDPEWAADLEEDVQEEVESKAGRLEHIRVDKESKLGHVWMRFKEIEAAQKAQKLLHGRWFTNRQLTAEFVPEATYLERFPAATKAAVVEEPKQEESKEPAAKQEEETPAKEEPQA